MRAWREMLGLVGFAAAVYGVWQLSVPGAWMLAGALIVGYAVTWNSAGTGR